MCIVPIKKENFTCSYDSYNKKESTELGSEWIEITIKGFDLLPDKIKKEIYADMYGAARKAQKRANVYLLHKNIIDEQTAVEIINGIDYDPDLI